MRLRRDCPWDREQTAETIVPHTIEEAFEVADAVAQGGAGLPDELGDLLFQAVFLSQLLEERGTADLALVARGQADKLVARHPHVYGDAAAGTASRVVDMWERRKREERAGQGIFHELPAGLPALAYATKAQRRAAAVGFDFPGVNAAPGKAGGGDRRAARGPGGPRAGGRAVRRGRGRAGDGRRSRASPCAPRRSASGSAWRARSGWRPRPGAEFESLPVNEQLRWYEASRVSGSPA